MSEFEVVRVPMFDTGLGQEAGYADDAALLVTAAAQREELRLMLTPEAFERLEAAEAEGERQFLFGQ